jgi:hypothetical protein
VQFLSLDDVLFNNKITEHINVFDGLSNDYAVVYSDMQIIGDDGSIINDSFIKTRSEEKIKKSGYIFSALLENNFLPAPGLFFRMHKIKSIGCFDESLYYEDYDLYLRLAKNNLFYYLNIPLIKYRKHNDNLTITWQNRDPNMVYSDAEIFHKWLKYEELKPEELHLIKQKFIVNYKSLIRNHDLRSARFKIAVLKKLEFKYKLVAFLVLVFNFKSYRVNQIVKYYIGL